MRAITLAIITLVTLVACDGGEVVVDVTLPKSPPSTGDKAGPAPAPSPAPVVDKTWAFRAADAGVLEVNASFLPSGAQCAILVGDAFPLNWRAGRISQRNGDVMKFDVSDFMRGQAYRLSYALPDGGCVQGSGTIASESSGWALYGAQEGLKVLSPDARKFIWLGSDGQKQTASGMIYLDAGCNVLPAGNAHLSGPGT